MPPAVRAARRWLVAGLLLLAPLIIWLFLAPTPVARGKQAAAPLPGGNTPEQQRAQDLALADPRVVAALAGHRAEVFGVRAAGAQFSAEAATCAAADCRQVEIYLFDTDTAVLGLVDLNAGLVRAVLVQPGVQPGFNQRVADRAAEIARLSPALQAEAGYVPDRAALTPMSGGGCPSDHLCVAMTLPAPNSLIWAVVDMTTETLVDVVRTSTPGNALGAAAEAETDAAALCPAGGTVERYGWHVEYATTASDGFAVANVSHAGVAVLTSAKLAEWHVDYGITGFEDSTGCGGGGGGYTIYPFGATAVLPVTSTSGVPGFDVAQDFRMGNWGAYCNYRYGQHYQFFADGSFRAVVAAYGKGCATDSVYRPLLRLDVGVGGAPSDTLQTWDGSSWITTTTEAYAAQAGPYTAAGAKWRVRDATGRGYLLIPGQGQFADSGTGDNAYLYGIVHHAAEGDTDLGILGNCCIDDQRQGPDEYIDGEVLAGQDVVLWYVPQQVTDANSPGYYCWTVQGGANPITFPCLAGPLFMPEYAAGLWHDGPVTLGSSLHFTTTDRLGTDYTWDFGDGSPTAPGATATHTYTAPGFYPITLTVDSPAVDGVYTDTVYVGVAPAASFTAAQPGGVGMTFVFTNTSTGSAPLSYLWTFGDGLTSTLPAPSHIYTAGGPVTVTLTVSNPLAAAVAQTELSVPPPLKTLFPFIFK